MEIDLSTLSSTQIYHLMTQTIIPRPIAWVLTENNFDSNVQQKSVKTKDKYNLAPFSYFSAVSSNPPLLMISVGQKGEAVDKDTTVNAKLGSKAVIHIAAQGQFKAVTQSAATLDYGQSELANSNLKLVPFEGFSMPRLEQCPVAFGCHVYEIQKMGNAPQTLIFFEIDTIYVDDKATTELNGRLTIDANQIDPLSRLGAAQYGTLGQIVDQKRPK